ncbi:hypothetical protein KC725_05995 [Candidatus Peregrinibacteria bacterium]|nr:hypothetical protein [Candidatus Peregrinibacteria bacterium]
MPLFTNLKQIKYLFTAIGVAFLMFDVSYWWMQTRPGSRNNMCVMGANLTPGNIAFSLVLSAMIGVLAAGFIALFAQKYAKNRKALAGLSGIGMILGTMSVICTACTFPVLSLFGLTIWLDFFTHYEGLFKIVSLIMMTGSLYLLNQQLKDACAICAPMPEKVKA